MTLSNITTLSSFTDNAPASPTYMNAKFGEVNANFQTMASSLISSSASGLGWYNVKDYGAVGNGTTDDTAAIRLAIAAAGTAGGTVYFPTGNGERYSITSDLRVTSPYPVHLLMTPNRDRHDAYATGVGLVINSNISYPVYYTYPANRAIAGSGSIRGLTFWDPTDRGYRVQAVIYAKDMLHGLIEDVTIRHVRGGGILTEMFVQGTISRPNISYSGTTDAPAIQLGEGVSNAWVTQAAQVLDGRLEVNSGSTYVVLATPLTVGGNQGSNTVAFCQFETDSTVSTEWPYVDVDQHKCRVVNCGFNRNKHTHLMFRVNNGTDGLISGCLSDGDTSANTVRYQLDGQRLVVNNVLSRGAVSGTSAQIHITGNGGTIANVTMQRGGNLRSTAQLVTMTGLNVSNLDTARPAMVEVFTNNVLSDSMLWSSSLTVLPSISTAGATSWAYDNVLTSNVDGVATQRVLRGNYYAVTAPFGSATAPGYAFASEESLGWYRSAASTIAPSYGTVNLATNAVRLSMRTVAAASLDSTALAVNEVAFSVGGASGASLAIRSGSTIYYFASSASTKA